MKRNLLVLVLLLNYFSTLHSQLAYKDVAGIFYTRCTTCHHTGAHHFPFMNYSQISAMSPLIQNALVTGKMPPWSADTAFTRFQHERIITAPEKQKILDWISQGNVKGDTTLAPATPVYTSKFKLHGEADLTISIGKFVSTSLGTDKYYCFSIPSGLLKDRIIRAFEVVPGNEQIVHHAVITADTTGFYTSDLSGYCYNIPGNLGIGTYAPGMQPTIFPSKGPLKSGIYLKAKSKIIVQLHYPAGSNGQQDSTKIRLFFYPENETGVRRIYSTTPLQNWSMSIPPNSISTFDAWYPGVNSALPVSLSLYGVMPHSHLLCNKIVNYAVNPGVDTIPIVRVNKWDFKWQDYFLVKKIIKLPAGYKIYGKHTFDNTSSNPSNPNFPPAMVYAGTDTGDEMLFDGMMFLAYQQGDELIDLEEIINSDPLLGVAEISPPYDLKVDVYPNPFSNVFSCRYQLPQSSEVTISIFDLLGRPVYKSQLGQRQAGPNVENISFDQTMLRPLPGVYLLSLQTGAVITKRMIIMRE